MAMDYANSSEVDVAYHVLSEEGNTMHYKDLVLKVIELKQKPVQSLAASISEVYTLINMDSRFHYEGESQWGLTEWNPPETKRTHSASRAAAGTAKSNRRNESMFESIQE